MYAFSLIRPFRKEIFASISYKGQPKTYARNSITLIEVYLSIGAKVSSKSIPYL